MTLLYAVLLGIVQGATEFLPVSSSGHLVLAQALLGIQQPSLFFEVLLHVGTLFAVLAFYRNDVLEVIQDIFRGGRMIASGQSATNALSLEGLRIAIFVGLASVPTALIGLSLNDLLDPAREESIITPTLVAAALVLNGFMLYAYRWLPSHPASRGSDANNENQRETDMPTAMDGTVSSTTTHATASINFNEYEKFSTPKLWGLSIGAAFLVGIAQGAAVMPGISRSGATITAALLLGSQRENAAKFSFLLSIPAIVGAFLLKFRELDLSLISLHQWLIFLTGAAIAGIVGFLCLKWLVVLLNNTRFYVFGYYCWAVAGVVMLWSYF